MTRANAPVPEKGSEKGGRLRVRMPDRETSQEIRLILTYEATMRGLTLGQTCSELIAQVADVESYPEEVRARLDEIAQESNRRGIERSLSMSGSDDAAVAE